MPTAIDRRSFLHRASLLPLCAAVGAGASIISAAFARSKVTRTGGARLKTSLNAYSFNGLLNNHLAGRSPGMSLLELLEFCAQHDFDAIDPTGYYFPGYPQVPDAAYLATFKRRAFELGLDISGTGVRNNFAAPDPAQRAADVRHVKEWIEVAARMGAPVLRVFAGPVPKGYEQNWDEPAAWIVAALRECVDHARKFGVLIGVQNHGDMLRTADETLKIIHAVDSDWLGVIADTGNFHSQEPYEEIARVVPYAVNWQVKETLFGKESGVRLDLARLVGILETAGYRGYLPIETLAIAGREYAPHKLVPEFLAQLRAVLA